MSPRRPSARSPTPSTGRGPKTTLCRLLLPLAGCASPEELLQGLSRGLVPPPAAALLVLQAAESGDGARWSIVLRAGVALGESAAVVARRLGLHREAFEVVMAAACPGRNHLLETTLADVLHHVAPRATPVHLTCNRRSARPWRLLELAGACPGPAVRDRLVASSQGLTVSG